MKTLPKNWLTEGLIDFEYKKYQLLAYLQEAEREFRSVKVYPVLSDLVEHYKLLKEIESGKAALKSLFPKEVNGIDFQTNQLYFQPKIEDGQLMEELSQITAFAIPRVYGQIKEGRGILDFVEGNLVFEPVGIQPIYNKEGYLMVTQENHSDIYTFRYKSDFLQMAGEKFKNISFWLVGIFRRSWVMTLEKLKLHLIREIKDLPNPAAWRLHSQQHFPIQETILPVGKRLLINQLGDRD